MTRRAERLVSMCWSARTGWTASSGGSYRSQRHSAPHASVQLTASLPLPHALPRLVVRPPLLEEERHVSLRARIPVVSPPMGVRAAGARAALSAHDHPVDAVQV